MASKKRSPARPAVLGAQLTPAEALAKLTRGNDRFVHGKRRPALGWHRRIGERPPFAILLGCSDSRVPLEHVFDVEPGDLFVVRVAGNVVASSQIGSVEFAAGRFDCSLALVLGHTECGAVGDTLRWVRGESVPESDALRNIAERIRPHVGPLVRVAGRLSRKRLWKEAVRANVLASVDRLRHGSRLLEERVRDRTLKIAGAVYDLSTGRVEIVE